MNRHEQDVKLAARFYECRDAARLLLNDSYEATVQPWCRVIAQRMAESGKSILQAALAIGQVIPPSDGVPLMMLMAAAVEMMEQPPPRSAVDPVDGIVAPGPRASES